MMDALVKKQSLWFCIFLGISTPGISGIRSLVRIVRQRFNLNKLWFPLQETLRMKTLDRYFGFSIGQFKTSSSGLSREIISNGEQSMQSLASKLVLDVLPTVIRLIITSFMLLRFRPIVGWVCVAGFSIYSIAMWFLSKRFITLIEDRRDKSNRSAKFRGELLIGASLIKSYSKEEEMRERYRATYLTSVEASKKSNFYITSRSEMASSILLLTQATATILCIYLFFEGKMTAGALLTARIWWQQACDMVDDLGDHYQDILNESSSAKKFLELIDTIPAIREIDDPVHLKEVAGFINFRHVSFAFPKVDGTKGKTVVDDVSFYVNVGEHVAIVGPSGSGKTTLMTLLQRGYDPDAGVVEVDGHNLRNLALDDYYRHVAVVDQSSLMMDMSIRDMIQMGARRQLSDEEIILICRMVELDVNKIDGGLDKKVGEFGGSVSGGERQRIAIARALASDAKILILDEPTSSLDAIAEAKLRRALETASRGRTTITIAHRLVTVQGSDRIFVMEDGRITGSGTHHELLRSSGLYMQLVHEQKIEV
jgi:ATP-binding cassette subfamily B protein